jgi:hypothetical protein
MHLIVPVVLLISAIFVWMGYGGPGRCPRWPILLMLTGGVSLLVALVLGWHHESSWQGGHRTLGDPSPDPWLLPVPFLHAVWLIFWAVYFDRRNTRLAGSGGLPKRNEM